MFGTGFSSLSTQGDRTVFDQDQMKFVVGKYAGATFDQVLDDNPHYIVALYEKHAKHGLTKRQYNDALRAADDDKEDQRESRSRARMQAKDFWSL